MASQISRAVHRAEVIAGLDASASPSSSSSASSSISTAVTSATSIIQVLQGVCKDTSEKACRFFSSLLVGKSIVLEKPTNINATKVKRRSERGRMFSNKRRKLKKTNIGSELKMTQVQLESLHRTWKTYARGVLSSRKKSSHIQTRLQQLEFIGAYAVLIDAIGSSSKFRGLRGIIVDQTEKCYSLAEERNSKITDHKCEEAECETSALVTTKKVDKKKRELILTSEESANLLKITTFLKDEVVLAIYMQSDEDLRGNCQTGLTKNRNSAHSHGDIDISCMDNRIMSISGSWTKVLVLHGKKVCSRSSSSSSSSR